MCAWGKEKKLFDASIKSVSKLVCTCEREIHNRFKANKEDYCRKMMLIWEILETC